MEANDTDNTENQEIKKQPVDWILLISTLITIICIFLLYSGVNIKEKAKYDISATFPIPVKVQNTLYHIPPSLILTFFLIGLLTTIICILCKKNNKTEEKALKENTINEVTTNLFTIALIFPIITIVTIFVLILIFIIMMFI